MIGPLLFTIYIINIPTEINIHSDINLFADDAKISGKSIDALQLSLNSIYQWLKTRNLKLNPNKCRILNIHKSEPNPTNFFVNNTINTLLFITLNYPQFQYLRT